MLGHAPEGRQCLAPWPDAGRCGLPFELTVSSTSLAIFLQILQESELLAKEQLSGQHVVHLSVKVGF